MAGRADLSHARINVACVASVRLAVFVVSAKSFPKGLLELFGMRYGSRVRPAAPLAGRVGPGPILENSIAVFDQAPYVCARVCSHASLRFRACHVRGVLSAVPGLVSIP